VLIGLNKGEHLHSLARDIAFGRQGRFHDRGYEAQLNRASALSLAINAIAVWNTRYFERAQTALARVIYHISCVGLSYNLPRGSAL